MSLIATQVVGTAGTAPTFAAAAAGDTTDCGDRFFLVVKNGSGGSVTVTVVTPGNLVTGDAFPDKAYVVAPAGEAWVPLISAYADPTDQKAHLTYSATASVTRAVVYI